MICDSLNPIWVLLCKEAKICNPVVKSSKVGIL